MKIAILASSFPRYSGDYQGNFIYHHAYGQVLLGNEVHVICPHVPESPFYDVIDGIKVHRFPYFYPFRLQCLTSETGMYSALRQSPLAVFQLPLFCICMLYLTNRIIIRYDIDIIHSHWLIPQGLVGMIARKLRNIPHVLSSHGIDAQIFSRWPVLIPVLKLILSGTDVLTTNSTYTKKVITKLSPVSRPVRVIPMGVLPSQQVSQKKIISDEITILFVGRLIPWKGVDTLIKAMVHVLEKYPLAIISIVGDGPERVRLKSLAQDLGISGRVQFLGRVDEFRLSELYSNASVFILPSRSYQGMVMEGLGVVLLEAMSHGVPVIGSNVGGIPDIITDGENGFIFPCEDDRLLAEKIMVLLEDSFLKEQFRIAGYRTVRIKFSWEIISRKFSDIYRELLKQYSWGGSA